MRLEAIAALLGHRSMEMTLTYARIADHVVADEYQAVTAQIDALYNTAGSARRLTATSR
jgi:integrase